MSVKRRDPWQDYTPLDADLQFFSDAFKDVFGSRPGEFSRNEFSKLSEKDRQIELKDLCDKANAEHKERLQEEAEDLKNLQQYGDFSKSQLKKWGCL